MDKSNQSQPPSQESRVKGLARTYRIATSLNIAVARLREIVATVQVGADVIRDVATFTPAVRDGNERASITWQVESIRTRCGAWRVSIRRDRATWTHAGMLVFVTNGIPKSVGTDKSDAQHARAMRCVARRAAQLERELADLVHARVFVEVLAVAPTEVLLIVNALGGAGVETFRAIEYHIRALWPTAIRDEEAGAMLRNYPTDPNDARVIALLRDERMSYEEIARKLFVSTTTVKRWANELQTRGLVPARKRGRKGVKS